MINFTKQLKMAAWALCCSAVAGWAMTSAELKSLMDSGAAVTVIDIRAKDFYLAGHLPNAIHVPEHVLAYKKLPPLGRVVVYGQGVGTEKMDEAVRCLNEKAGIQAEALDGGYAAWEMVKGSTTQPAGFQEEQLIYLSYQDLEAMEPSDLALVDLRKPKDIPTGRLTRQGEAITEAEPLTSLSEKFPGRTVVTSPFDLTSRSGGLHRMASEPALPPAMVLIDNGNGEAEKMARILKANGIRGVAILAGGEEILKRDGESGLMRMGMGAQTVEGNHE